ncbi:MAG: hypothetical protein ABI183_12275, partial [Polyangiaceae bacterium]
TAPPPTKFYTQSIDANGVTIRASAKVEKATLETIRARVARVLANAPAIAANLKNAKVELHVIARGEVITDLPEYQPFRKKIVSDGETFERRFHGGKPTGTLFACSEENVMRDKSDPYPKDYDVCTHELAHLVLSIGLDSPAREKVAARYRAALDEGLYADTYAGVSFDEFFAEGSAHYFGYSGGGLAASDPTSFALLDSFYSGVYAPAASPVTDLVPLSGAALTNARSISLGGAPTSGIFLNNKSTSDLRVSQLDTSGALIATTSRILGAGTMDAPSYMPRTAIAVIDDKTKGIVAIVNLQKDLGRLSVDDKMVRAQKAPTADQLARASGPIRADYLPL